MRYPLFISLFISICAAVVAEWVLTGPYHWIIYVILSLSLILLLLLFRSVLKPAQTVRRGLELIAAQDFNNRLVKVEEPESDRLVKLFNTMIDKLRNERLLNMERENFLQLLVEASPMGVVMLDFNGYITMVNPSFLRITGLPEGFKVEGKEMSELPSELVQRMTAVALGKCEVIRHGDIRRYRCYHLSFIQSGFTRQFYLLESLTEEVMKAERSAYEKVIRIISHEVNNTMGGVRSVLGTLDKILEMDDIHEVIESCDERCERMTRFISSYADVVRVPEPIRSDVDLNSLVGDMFPFLQGMGSDRIHMLFLPADYKIEVNVDIELMQQVIVNIVKNAVESIQREGNIEILTGMEGGRPLLMISNDGEPISDEVSAQLFSPFFTTKREGRGIGLTLISEILNRHESVYSLRTGEDGITRFRIIF